MQDSLYHITQELPDDFVADIMAADSGAILNKKLAKETDTNKRALICARIDNINYLVS